MNKITGRSGIYKITNLINNKIYIGSSCNFKDRKSKHKNKRNNTLISRAIFKYGWDNFTFEVIEYCDKEILLEREQYYIDILQPFKENNGYNLLRNVIENGWLGHHHTDETKKIMSKKKEGYIPWNKGKIGAQICSEETRNKMSENNKGENNSFYGGSHSEETKNKIAAKNSGKDHSYEYKSVEQIDKNTGLIIKVWDNISDAAEQILGDRKSSAITAACRGRKKTTGGFIWQYHF